MDDLNLFSKATTISFCIGVALAHSGQRAQAQSERIQLSCKAMAILFCMVTPALFGILQHMENRGRG
jgi:hypothetical protein